MEGAEKELDSWFRIHNVLTKDEDFKGNEREESLTFLFHKIL